MERLILARHAESVFNVRGVLNGDPSIPGGLMREGRAQAARLGDRLESGRIDLCVTTEFERTRETADIALAGRDVQRLVVPELNDPPNGDLELQPYGELLRWREANGPDVPVPGLARTERDYFETVVAWITSCAGAPASGGHAEETLITTSDLVAALDAVADDVFLRWSWETSGRPLLFGIDESD